MVRKPNEDDVWWNYPSPGMNEARMLYEDFDTRGISRASRPKKRKVKQPELDGQLSIDDVNTQEGEQR
jgi:hypothetical protein